ncbi:MAG: GPR endopeptidase [Oscillospiraceae bacterium]|nr:GPR endopeptidase [Oscillospiraceae bacterium]
MAFRTDLALEATEAHLTELDKGVIQKDETICDLTINRVKIVSDEAAGIIGKPPGDYITITVPAFYSQHEISEERICAIADEIRAMLPKDGLVLVVGLGNNDITPDAVGPRTVRQVLATRHISGELAAESGLPDLRAAAAIAPGVLGQTGIETSEIIRSLVDDIAPSAVIVIDALAARSASRLGNTVQIATSGISPGSGVMNSRKELSRETLGVPVVSIGIPTVVDAATLAGDLLKGGGEDFRGLFEPEGNAMMITPREIDVLIGHACKTLSLAVNKALQPGMTLEEIGYLVS